MAEHFSLNPTFQPVLLAGQSARLFTSPNVFYDVKVIAVGPLGIHRHDFGTIAADTLNQECTHIEMPTGMLGQFRYIARGQFDIVLQNPSGVDQYVTSGSIKSDRAQSFRMFPWAYGIVDSDLEEVLKAHWAMSEFFVLEDTTPRFDLYPYAPLGGIEAYVDIFGFRYALEKLPAGKVGTFDIWVRGFPAGKSLIA